MTPPRNVEVRLTRPEANHLLALLEFNKQEGSYTAPKKQYWDRHDRIVMKLAVAVGYEALP